MTTTLRPQEYCGLRPGLWSLLLVGESTTAEQHVLDLLILRRPFEVIINKGIRKATASGKREAKVELDVVSKRAKKESDATTRLSTSIKLPRCLSGLSAALALPTIFPNSVTTVVGSTPLLYLKDGDTSDIQAIHFKATGPATYKLSRLERVALKNSASVFTAWHSAHPEVVVAKVMKFQGGLGYLAQCATIWKREILMLEKLSHVRAPFFFQNKRDAGPRTGLLTPNAGRRTSYRSSPSMAECSRCTLSACHPP